MEKKIFIAVLYKTNSFQHEPKGCRCRLLGVAGKDVYGLVYKLLTDPKW